MRVAALALAFCLTALPAPAKTLTLRNRIARVSFDATGAYRITGTATGWELDGTLPAAPSTLHLKTGTDRLGAWREIDAACGTRIAGIRVYASQPVLLFLDTYTQPAPNTAPFPAFDALPHGLMRLGYGVNTFAKYQFGKLAGQGPWLLFDADRNTMVLSPADHFLASSMQESASGKATSGIDAQIESLPRGFVHRTMLVLGTGIDATLNVWGHALEAGNGKRPVPNDADVVLNKFGYWTDNGATYYYKFDPALGYEGTLLAVRDQYRQLGVPIAYMQLDSWWYPKANGNIVAHTGDNGTMVYRADPTVFPRGLDAFHRQLGLPLATHARWIAETSPYRKQYRMSRNVILDPRFWNATADYLHRAGVVLYEQDWLDHNARPAVTLADPHEFLANMADGMARDGIGIQYCMPLPGYFLASTEFQNLRTIRTSDDRFERARWDMFLYGSALAHAVGLWPWADVFMSRELPNLVLATLSAGPVGVGDALGAIDAENLKRVMRSDSVILKPDTPLVPSDATFRADATHPDAPMVAVTHSGGQTLLFAYPRNPDTAETNVSLQDLGISGPVYAYDWVRHKGQLLSPGDTLSMTFADGWAYTVLVPVRGEGLALLGDTGKIVPLAAKRFRTVTSGNTTEATVAFAAGEGPLTVTAYAAHAPKLRALRGEVSAPHYDRETRLFTFSLQPGSVTPGVAAEAAFRIE